jgi:hypothetical protein
MAKKFPIRPANPERICWGCDRYCPADKLMCGNGTVATPHPSELFGEDWLEWGWTRALALPRSRLQAVAPSVQLSPPRERGFRRRANSSAHGRYATAARSSGEECGLADGEHRPRIVPSQGGGQLKRLARTNLRGIG